MAYDFSGQVAIVTGGAQGLGRAYSTELARLGAKVLCNDVGCNVNGSTSDATSIDFPVHENIVCDTHNIVTNPQEIVDHALECFGKIDILIHNATILRDSSFGKMTLDDWDSVMKVNVLATFRLTNIVWNIFQKSNKCSKILFSTSASGLYGNFGQANYSAAKTAILGFANTLAIEGSRYNIAVNTVAAVASTRLTEGFFSEDLMEKLSPKKVAPMVLFLVHPTCKQTKGLYELGGNWIGALRYERSKGVVIKEDKSIENLSKQWEKINDFEGGATHPSSTQESFGPMLHSVSSTMSFHNDAESVVVPLVFKKFEVALRQEKNAMLLNRGVFKELKIQWKVLTSTTSKMYLIDFSSQSVSELNSLLPQANNLVTLTLTEDTLVKLAMGKLNPERALALKIIEYEGSNKKVAMQLKPLLQALNTSPVLSHL